MFGIKSVLNAALTGTPNFLIQPTRNTFILRRKWPPPLHKKGGRPGKLRARHFVYDLVEDTNVVKKSDIKIILNQFVDGVGNTGDVLDMRPTKAYKEFLVPGLAVYATPENFEKYKVDESKPKAENIYSSPYVQRTMGCLSRLVLQITMNKKEPWTLEPWHIRTSFRKSGYVVPEHAIIMPPIKIKGPDLALQQKEFYVTVKNDVKEKSNGVETNKSLNTKLITSHKSKFEINSKLEFLTKRQIFEDQSGLFDKPPITYINSTEEVNVRCRIHHWATGVDRLPSEDFHWKKPLEALIPEQAEVLEKMPLH